MERLILIAYALLLFVGGYFGLKKGGSMISLIMGSVSALIILWGVKILSTDPKTAYLILSVVSVLLTIVFVLRLLKTHAFMPSGMLLVMNLAAAVFCILKFLKFS